MTAAPHHVPSSSAYAVPRSQNTAPVHEFRCLYTHDIRRKSKRWQDGFLRFHTFNKRVMVYDDQRNFIGDLHLQEGSEDPQDGDEVSLERGSALVQIGEQNGSVEQDLTGLLAKRVAKPVEKEPGVVRTGTQLLPRSPNIIRQSPQRLGRATVVQNSPFEIIQRTAGVEDWEQGPSAKRQRRDDNHIPLWALLKTSNPSRSSSAAGMTAPIRSIVSGVRVRPETQLTLKVKETIDLTSSLEKQVEKPTDPLPRSLTRANRDMNNHNASVARQSKAPERLRVAPAASQKRSRRLELNMQSATAKISKGNVELGAIASSPTRSRPSPTPRVISAKSRSKPIISSEAHPTVAVDILTPNTNSINSAIQSTRLKRAARPNPLSSNSSLNIIRSPSPAVSTTSHLPKPVEGESETNGQDEPTSLTTTKPKNTMKPLRLSSRAPKKTLLCQSLIPPGALDLPQQEAPVPEQRSRSSKTGAVHKTPSSPRQVVIPSSPSATQPSSPEQTSGSPIKQTEIQQVEDNRPLRKAKTMPFSDGSDSEPAFETPAQQVKTKPRKSGGVVAVSSPELDIPPPKNPSAVTKGSETVEARELGQNTITTAAQAPQVPSNSESTTVETTMDLPPIEDAESGVKPVPKAMISAMRATLQNPSRETNPDLSFRPPTKVQSNPNVVREGAPSNAGPDYSHLDAQLLTKPRGIGSTENQLSKALEPIRPLDAIQIPPRPNPANPQFKALSISKPKKPLARSHSINTSNEARNDGPTRRLNTGLQRAETLPNNSMLRHGLPSPEVIEEDGTDQVFNANLGPWSREAWDLLGWAPPDRKTL